LDRLSGNQNACVLVTLPEVFDFWLADESKALVNGVNAGILSLKKDSAASNGSLIRICG